MAYRSSRVASPATPATGARPSTPREASPLPYVPAWDGLRAVAVLAVLVYHAGFEMGRGGWLGVSTFFTLSGYLITSLLLATRSATGELALRAFWARRARRLLPAAGAGMALALMWTALLADAAQRARIPGDVAAALAYVTNWRFVLAETSYADLFRDPSPLQHYWSLAIEEQFYLLFPLLVALVLVAAHRRDRSRRDRSTTPDSSRWLAAALTLGAVASALWTTWLHTRGAGFDRLYYGTDTRAGELLVGAALAAAVRGHVPGPGLRRMLALLAPAALVTLLGLYATTSFGTPWLVRGGFVGVAVLAVVVIEAARDEQTVVARVLGFPALRSLGVVSYGIYLYHWPVFLWLREAGWAPAPVLTAGGTLTVLAAALSYRLLEAPIRSGGRVRGQTRILAPAVTVAALCGATLVVGAPQPADDPVTLLAQAAQEGIAPAPSLPAVTVAGRDRPLRVLVVGDEPAGVLASALAAWQGSDVERLEVRDASGIPCGERLASVSAADPTATTCAGWVAGWSPHLVDFDPDVVVVAPAWWDARRLLAAGGSEAPPFEDPSATTWLRRRLTTATDLLASQGALVAVVEFPHPQSVGGQAEVADGVRSALRALRDVAVAHPASSLLATAEELGAEDVGTATDGTHAEGHWPPGAADLLAPRLLSLVESASPADPVRIMVVGDSVSWFVGRGLERWGRDQGSVLVWNTGSPGCGIARRGEVMLTDGPTESDPACDSWAERWSAQLEDFDPDVVVVLSGLWDLAERRLEDWHGFHAIGEPVFDRYLLDEYRSAVELLRSRGAQVVWLTAPCYAPAIFPGPLAGTGALEPERQHQYNTAILPALAREQQVQIEDLAALVCPTGSFTQDWGGLTGTRPDGVHFSEAATDAIAEWLGPRLHARP